jgi:hypothetical protein
MSNAGVVVLLDGERTVFQSGERLSGRYQVFDVEAADLQSVEVAVYWFTDGKGDEDQGVHFHHKRQADDPSPLTEGTFATILPPSPLSYDGVLFKIVWCVRVRAVRGGWSKPLEGTAYFHIGDVAPAYEARA